MRISLVTTSKVPLSKARPYVRGFNRATYANIFNKYGEGKGKDKYRIYIPANAHELHAQKAIVVPPEIQDYFDKLGMKIDNYLAGTALMADGKRTVRMGKVLSKQAALKQMYDNDPQRRSANLVSAWVVISRHPYDIIGMSFDRGWTSCMELGEGMHEDYLADDAKLGTLVAYLVKTTDRNINNPTARIAIRPYDSKGKGTKHTVLVPGPVYGVAPASFTRIVKQFCTYANSGSPHGLYHVRSGLYDDNIENYYNMASGDLTDEELKKLDDNKLDHVARDTSSSSMLARMAKIYHDDSQVLYRIAQNVETPPELLIKFLKSEYDDVQYAAIQNPSMPLEKLRELGKTTKNRDIQYALTESPTYRPYLHELAVRVAARGHTFENIMPKLSNKQFDDVYAVSKNKKSMLSAIAYGDDNWPLKFHVVLNYPYNEELWSLVSYQVSDDEVKIPEDVQLKLAFSKDQDSAKTVAMNTELESVQLAIVEKGHSDLLYYVAANKNTTAKTMTALITRCATPRDADTVDSMFRNKVFNDEHWQQVLQPIYADQLVSSIPQWVSNNVYNKKYTGKRIPLFVFDWLLTQVKEEITKDYIRKAMKSMQLPGTPEDAPKPKRRRPRARGRGRGRR